MKTTSTIILVFLSIFAVIAQPQMEKPQNPSQQLGYKVNNSVTKAQIVNIPDANFKMALIQQGVDKNKDGQIQNIEAELVDTLLLGSKSIASLIGIEAFINLKVLNCYSNQLTTLDISKNVALKVFHCFSNQLTTLDISKNSALKKLSCGSNKLATLDLSKNTALIELDCNFNHLVTLNVSKNTALTGFTCYENSLTTLDVSSNTALTLLDCHANLITILDVSKNTALKGLYCYSNQLTTLDVSKNIVLTTLSCASNLLTTLDISKNTALIGFNCYKNSFTTLDVSKNTALENFNCFSNLLTTLDVSKNTALSDFSCKFNPNLTKVCVNTIQLGLTNSAPFNWKKDDTSKWSTECMIQAVGKPKTFTDLRDGKTYKTVKIGTQTWMAENLAYKAINGCWAYNNDENNISKYGLLYNNETAIIACPSGWHLPSEKELEILINYLGGADVACSKLNDAGF